MRNLLLTVLFVCGGMVPEQLEARPWCSASGLNATERTICQHDNLRRLDAELLAAYGQAKARNKDYGQLYWLRQERDACRYNRGCIERQYISRISVLRNRSARIITRNSRPWCSASRLNLTEQTICNSSRLSDLDATLQLTYEQARARGLQSGQLSWLRNERDRCGSRINCIENTYTSRIAVLRNRLKPYRSVSNTTGNSSCNRSRVNELKAVCVIAAVGERACASKLADELGAGAFTSASAGGVCGAAATGIANGSIDPNALGLSVASGFMDGLGDSLLDSDDGASRFFGVLFKIGSVATSVVAVSDCFDKAERLCR